MIKGILFDKDGTLLKFDELWNEATKMVMPKFLHKIGIDADEENVSMAVKSVGNSIAAMTYRDMTKAVIEFFEIEADDKMLSLEEVTKSTANILPTADLDKLFKWLSDRKLIVGLATADTKQTALKCLDRLGVRHFFSYVGSDDGVLKPKPSSDIIEDFKRRFEINSDEIMVVGDTNTDMQFAKNGGALAVGVLSGVGEKEELKESADFIIADVGQLMYSWKNIEIQESR